MNLFALPWLEWSIAAPLIGAAGVGLTRDARSAARWGLGFTAAALACAVLASVGHYAGHTAAGARLFAVDDLNAPLLPLVALLHFLTALMTARTKMAGFSFPALLAGAGVRLAVFACVAPWPLVGLLAVEAVLPVLQRRPPGRLYAVHAAAFIGLLVAGWATAAAGGTGLGSALILAAVLVRTGAVPAQVWVTDLFESRSFGAALLFAAPLAGVCAAVRLALPIAPEWALEAFGVMALATAAYAAGMGVVQTDARRFFAYLLVSHAALVLVGLGLHTPFAVTGALVMWLSGAVSLTGLGLTLRAVEARVGPLNLTDYRGLYDQAPALAVCFLLTGLATVGFPGTSGFVAVELLASEAVRAHEVLGLAVVLIAALNGVGVVRAYLLIFTGRRHVTGVALGATPRERAATLILAALILAGGLFPQAYLESRHRVAEAALRGRPETAETTPHGKESR